MPLFHGLTPEQLEELRGLLRQKVCAAKTTVVAAEQPGEAVYLIVHGSVKVYVEHDERTEVILAILGPGQTIGEMSVSDDLGHSASVVTSEETNLLWMGRAKFQHLLQTMPLLTYNLARILSGRLRRANQQIQALATLDVFGRVAHQLLAFARDYGDTNTEGPTLIPIRFTQGDLANMVGATRGRVNHVLGHFTKNHYISENSQHQIIIHNWEALSQYCK
jgi:CRP/FNR family cyclic AMP-dependent transcriptional regulator